jgi:C-terminal processing protease CtpA/Prc
MFGIGAPACGVGVQLKKNGDGSVAVGGLAPGGPAQANGVRIDDVIEQVRCNRQKDSSFIPLPVCANPDPAAAPLAPLASASG